MTGAGGGGNPNSPALVLLIWEARFAPEFCNR